MIDIKFLNVIPEVRLRSGLEFLDWQDKNFYTELSHFFEGCTNTDLQFVMGRDERKELEGIIRKHSNIDVSVRLEEWGNAAIDVGYINPHSLLNVNDLDQILSPSETKTGELMKKLGTKILKGWCDLKTGKVEGDFKKIEFKLYLGESLPAQCMHNAKRFPKGVTLSNVLASIVLHEVGHAFFGLHYVSASVIDNAVCMAVVKTLANQPDKNRKAVIVKNIKNITEIDLSKALEVDDLTPESVLVFFKDGVANRDAKRALSLGVTEMTAEVLADAYCIRMGGSHGIVGFLSRKITSRPAFVTLAIGVGIMFFPILIGLGGLLSWIGLSMFLGIQKVTTVSGEYDTPYRRLKNIVRENVAFINSKPAGFTPAQLAKAKSDALELDKIAESCKPTLESTWYQRFIGHRAQGKQFRKNDFEHYTAELASSRLVLHTNLSR